MSDGNVIMPKPRLIIIVRHGESAANCDRLVNQSVQNHLVQLTEAGHIMARDAGKDIAGMISANERVRIYQSPYSRTRQTAAHINEELQRAGLATETVEEPRLREQDFGNFQDPNQMNHVLQERALYGSFFFRIHNGESAADVYDRCCSFAGSLHRHMETNQMDVVVLVSHGIWGRVFLMKWFGWSYEKFESLKNLAYCQPIVMARQDDGSYKLQTGLATWDDGYIY